VGSVSWAAKASRERERRRLRRRPEWTWSRAWLARSIHSKGEGGGEAVELGAEVDVAQELGGAGVEEEEVFEQQREGAEERGGLLLAVGSGAVGLGHLEERGVVGVGDEPAVVGESQVIDLGRPRRF
jgi:hypothetical protein